MNNSFVFDQKVRKIALIVFIILVAVTVAAEVLGHAAMTNWFSVKVSNIYFENQNGLTVRGKLYQPANATPESPVPRCGLPARLPE